MENVHVALSHSLPLRVAVRIAPRVRITVTRPKRTGEIRFWHPTAGSARQSARRKDTTRAVQALFKRAMAVEA